MILFFILAQTDFFFSELGLICILKIIYFILFCGNQGGPRVAYPPNWCFNCHTTTGGNCCFPGWNVRYMSIDSTQNGLKIPIIQLGRWAPNRCNELNTAHSLLQNSISSWGMSNNGAKLFFQNFQKFNVLNLNLNFYI
jgi:hypothetical protein